MRSLPAEVIDPAVRSFMREHPGLVVSAAYLAATSVGMLSSWTLYARFGIDIFQFAQLSDFILSAMRMPLASLAILLAIPAVWLIMRSDVWLTERVRWYKYLYGPPALRAASRSPGAWILYFALYAYAFSLLYSTRVEERIRAQGAPAVTVELSAGTYRGMDATRPFRTGLLGTTSTFVFLYDDDSSSVTAVPLENVASLTLE